MTEMDDIRDDIFRRVAGKGVTAAVIADANGLVAETGIAERFCAQQDLRTDRLLTEGSRVRLGTEIIRFSGFPKQAALAEERLIAV